LLILIYLKKVIFKYRRG